MHRWFFRSLDHHDEENVPRMFHRLSVLVNRRSIGLELFWTHMSHRSIRIGVCQLNSGDDKAKNLAVGEQLIRQGKEEQVKVRSD